jgi:hypothetical protein
MPGRRHERGEEPHPGVGVAALGEPTAQGARVGAEVVGRPRRVRRVGDRHVGAPHRAQRRRPTPLRLRVALGQATGDPVVHQLTLVAAEGTEHGRAVALDQLPEAAGGRVLVAADPADLLELGEEVAHAAALAQPLADAAAPDLAGAAVERCADRRLALEDVDQLVLEVEALDRIDRADAEQVELVAGDHAAVERARVTEPGQHRLQAFDRFPGVAGRGVVDGDVQAKVGRVDAELVELVAGDEQVQRQLLVAQIEADQLGAELGRVLTERELDRALREERIGQLLPALAAMLLEQLAIDDDVVQLGAAVAELLEIGPDQRRQARIAPVPQQPVQPGAVDQLGRRHRLQQVKRMRSVGEITPRLARAATGEVGLIRLADLRGGRARARRSGREGLREGRWAAALPPPAARGGRSATRPAPPPALRRGGPRARAAATS